MSDQFRFNYRSGRLRQSPLIGFWSPSLTVKDPQIPNLPLETPSGGTTYFGILKRWTGTVWAKAKLMVYTGTWVAKPLYRWTGSAWVEVDATGI